MQVIYLLCHTRYAYCVGLFVFSKIAESVMSIGNIFSSRVLGGLCLDHILLKYVSRQSLRWPFHLLLRLSLKHLWFCDLARILTPCT